MENKHLIMGTAGHVDHGKTSLIKALTGYDCDTHKQEKERGITINLGFTHFDLDEKNSLSIVDVPGHADFINTMVSGSAGIDFVLFVIAADEGIMPQTYEHFEIMKILNVKSGLIALTKVDSVDNELVELAIEEINDFVQNSFLEEAPIISTSSLTGTGIDILKSEINKIFSSLNQKESVGFFRMYIDRIFTVKGFGTVVNGSVLSGNLSKDDKLFLLPENREIRIRSLQRHSKNVEQIVAGDRGSLNIAGLKKDEFKRGMVLSSKYIKPTKMIDAKINLLKNNIEINRWSHLILLMGTVRTIAKMHLIDKNIVNENGEALVQFYLAEDIIAIIGDKFILRDTSDTQTIGGGEIIDAYPLHHRRRKQKDVDELSLLASGELSEIISVNVRKSIFPRDVKDLSKELNIMESEVLKAVNDGLEEDIVIIKTENPVLFTAKIKEKIKNDIMISIKDFHKKNPYVESGRNFKELMGIFGKNESENNKIVLKEILRGFIESNTLKEAEGSWILSNHKVILNAEAKKKLEKIENLITKSNLNLIKMSEIFDNFNKDKNTEKQIKMMLEYLERKNRIRKIDVYFISEENYLSVKKKLINYLQSNSQEGIVLKDYRDLIGVNRKVAMLLLDYFEKQKVVYSRENIRFLR
ncbi:MAG: selenocysteine-specific translation elongation factor [Candidatus Cloacimonetes bacterium]|nr:selenocysteine-specific translation elongation factor [Candidatus Cloacimonadota bacterium]